jgi:hypothetical protein
MKPLYTTEIMIMATCFLISCNSTEKGIAPPRVETTENNYTINNNLSSTNYSSLATIKPKDGYITTPEMAAKIAEIILIQIYGKEQIEKEKPFSVNLENNIWIVEGYWDKEDYNTFGGVAYMELSKQTGEILKVVHTK